MAILRDYRCTACGHIEEMWNNADHECAFCGAKVESIVSGTSFSLPGHDTGYPTAADKWARRHRSANHTELKRLGIPH